MSRSISGIALGAMLAFSPTPVRAEPAPQAEPEPAAPEPAPPEPAPPEPAPPEPVAPSAPPAPTPEEEAALEAALAGDRAAAPAAATPALAAPLSTAAAAVQSLNPDLAAVLAVAGAWFSVEEPGQTGAHDPRATGFTLQELELVLGASVDPFLRLDGNVVFSPAEGVDLEEAYATTLSLPWGLQARAGQFLHRFGRTNPTHPHAWRFVDQPLLLGKLFGGEGSRAPGAELSWLTPLPWFVEGVVEVTNAQGRTFAGPDEDAPAVAVEAPEDLLVGAHLSQFFPLHDDLSLLIEASGQAGPTFDGERAELWAADAMLRWRPLASETRWALTLELESMLRRRGRGAAASMWDGGGHAQLVWNIDPSWETAARYELVSGLADDPADADWSTWRQRGTAQLTFFPSHFSRLRLQGSVDHPTWQAGLPTFAVMLALEVLAGAHGAHSY